jgi:hypothetical protein
MITENSAERGYLSNYSDSHPMHFTLMVFCKGTRQSRKNSWFLHGIVCVGLGRNKSRAVADNSSTANLFKPGPVVTAKSSPVGIVIEDFLQMTTLEIIK